MPMRVRKASMKQAPNADGSSRSFGIVFPHVAEKLASVAYVWGTVYEERSVTIRVAQFDQPFPEDY